MKHEILCDDSVFKIRFDSSTDTLQIGPTDATLGELYAGGAAKTTPANLGVTIRFDSEGATAPWLPHPRVVKAVPSEALRYAQVDAPDVPDDLLDAERPDRNSKRHGKMTWGGKFGKRKGGDNRYNK